MLSDSLPLWVLQEIDRVCDSFEAAWCAGLNPRIEDYLAAARVDRRTEFFVELLAHEVELRKKAGETAVVADYVPRFREYGEQILTALRQASHTGLTLIVPPTSSGREPETPPPMGEPFGEPGSALGRAITWDPALGDGGEPVAVPERIGRFRVIRLIGQGNFVVYLAHDDRGCEVALKVARPGDPFSRRRMLTLAEEAQRLRASIIRASSSSGSSSPRPVRATPSRQGCLADSSSWNTFKGQTSRRCSSKRASRRHVSPRSLPRWPRRCITRTHWVWSTGI